MTFKKKRELSKVRFELEGSPEEIAQCKPGGCIDGEHGNTYLIQSVNAETNTIEVVLTVSQPFRMPIGLGRDPHGGKAQ
jgi:hypothetical protein